MTDDTPPADFYINIVLTEEQQASVDKFMQQSGYGWLDFVRVEIPNYFQFPFQIQYCFRKRAFHLAGDVDYSSWSKGDTFVHDDDPHGVEYIADSVDQEYGYVYFPDPDRRGEQALTRMINLRRIKKRGE